MSLNKKVVWLPYDMDTAIGINNSGLLVFGYSLEDIDLQEGGEFIFNGQDSVFWTNLRDAFGGDIKAMYQTLRSTGAISYDKVEQMFENHQSKWCEAIFNEDAYFKYIEPLTNPENGKQPDASYLPMAQGSKAEQRKWWLYNRFRYMDSKWNAGDALTDYIMMRAYSVAPQVLTPYADIYLTTAWDGELTQVRAHRGQTYTLPCPKDSANDAVVAIYSASQLADIGDLSGLKIKNGNFSMATRLQNLKIGDSDPNYSNTNLTDLQLGNNTLMKILDVRNCPNLAITVDISGCKNIEEVYFDGTSIAGVVLPNGGILNTLHLPNTITNLTVQNQPNMTDFVLNDASNLSTLRLENCGKLMNNAKDLVSNMEDGSRIRLIGINWEFESGAAIKRVFDKINTDRGLDEQGGNVNIAQLTGTVHATTASSSFLKMLRERYRYVTFTADETYSLLSKYSTNGLDDADVASISPLITSVKVSAFKDNTIITEINMPNATTIKDSSFYGCSKLKKLYLPNVTTIGLNSFRGTKLEKVAFPSLITPNTSPFFDCQSLTTLDLGQAHNSISNHFAVNAPLTTLILRYENGICPLGSTKAFYTTPFDEGGTGGTIYIPEVLYNHLGDGSSLDYQSATNWSVVHGYGTITWAKIEGSYYETHYGDDTLIQS